MSTTGSCLCGAVNYTFTGAPATVVSLPITSPLSYATISITFPLTLISPNQARCHCLTCQKLSGSAFSTNLIVPASSFSLTKGSVKSYSFVHPTGLALKKSFCADCGTAITKEGDGGLAGTVLVQAGTVDNEGGQSTAQHGKGIVAGEGGKEVGVQRSFTKPVVEFWLCQKAAWIQPLDGVPGFEEFAPGTVPENAKVSL